MKYYVMFMEPDAPAWWMAKMKKGFRHCGLLKDYGDDLYLYLENLYNSIHLDITFMSLADIQKHTGATIVEYEIIDEVPTRMNHLEPITCVTVIKKTLGIPDIWIQTPYQLYKYLLKNGGTVWED